MSPRSWDFRVADILKSVNAILDYTRGMVYEDFVADRKTVDAVIRNLTIIGEAAAHVPEEVTVATPELRWDEMRAMRNVVVHEYFGVSDRILWHTVRTNIPALVSPLRDLLERQE